MEEKKKYCQSCKYQKNKPSTCHLMGPAIEPLWTGRKETCGWWEPKK